MYKRDIWIGDNCMLTGTVHWEDDSFDHAFGFKKQGYYDTKDMSIIVYINNMDYDVTAAFPKDGKQYEYFKDKFLREALRGG